jgi:hypothetical protein
MRALSGPSSVASLAAFLTCLAGCGGTGPIDVSGTTGKGDLGTGIAASPGTAAEPASDGSSLAGTGTAGTGAVEICSPDAEGETTPVAPSCGATCGTPAGDVQQIGSIDAAYTVMQGRWEFCDDAWLTSAGAPSDAIGVDFAPASREPTSSGSTVGGQMYYLVAGPSGPQRGQGFAYQLTYDISPEGSDSSSQINIHPAPNSGFWIRLRYSPCPLQLEVWVFYSDKPTTMVRSSACGGA